MGFRIVHDFRKPSQALLGGITVQRIAELLRQRVVKLQAAQFAFCGRNMVGNAALAVDDVQSAQMGNVGHFIEIFFERHGGAPE